MLQETAALDLVMRWEELRDAGQPISAEELCRDCPELLDEVASQLQALLAMEQATQDDEEQTLAAALDTPKRSEPRPASPDRSAGSWPSILGYDLLEELNRSGMGIVYKAWQTGLDRIVALKDILPQGRVVEERKARFVREAQLMARLRQPNTTQIRETGEDEGHPSLVMEYLPAGTLSEQLKGKPAAPRRAAELTAILARAAHSARAQGVIHPDLKPPNILMTADGTAKIGDFGLAKRSEGPADNTQADQVLGNPSYMAPEQRGDPSAVVGPAADVYALGALLYQLLTGRPPFPADNSLDTRHMLRVQDPLSPRRYQPQTPHDLETICLHCLEKDPRRRYASAEELADDLDRFLAGKPIAARPIRFVERCWRWSRRHASSLIVLAGLTVTAVLVLVMAFYYHLAGEFDHSTAGHRRLLPSQVRLHRARTNEVANRLYSDLCELAAVPSGIAALLAAGEIDEESRLEQMLQDTLRKSPRIFGMCVAMEPFQWHSDRADFALYVHRGSKDRFSTQQLLPPLYRPLYTQWEWYRMARESTCGRWSEPYVGAGGDRTPMVTFSAPIRRDGRFAGVVTADLAVDYFRQFRNTLDGLRLGRDSYCFAISADDKILAHPEDRYEFPGPDSDLNLLGPDASFRGLLTKVHHDAGGAIEAVDFASHRKSTFVFSRIRSANWVFFIVERGAELAPLP